MTQLDHTTFLGRSLSTLIILQILHSMGKQSGYLLLHTLARISNGMLNAKAGTLYPQIDKLHKEGYVSKVIEPSTSSTGRTRDVAMFSINENGTQYLKELSREWQPVAEFIENLIGGKISE